MRKGWGSRPRMLFAVVTTLLGVADSSRSQAAPNAEALLRLAKEDYRLGRLERSEMRLRRALARPGTPQLKAQVHLYLGLNAVILHSPGKAKWHFAKALRQDPTLALDTTQFKPALVRLFDEVRRREVGRLTLRTEPPGAMLELDGAPLGKAPQTCWLTAGEHHIVARWAKRTRRRVLKLAPGTQLELRLQAPSRPPATEKLASRTPLRRSTAANGNSRLWTWIALGAAATTAAVGLGFGISAKSDYDEYLETDSRLRYDELRDRIPSKARVANILYATAGALAVTATLLFFLEANGTTAEAGGAASAEANGRWRVSTTGLGYTF